MPDSEPQPLAITTSPGLSDWLAEQGIALAITTYQAGRLLLVGRGDQGQLVVQQRQFPRAMGAWSDGDTLWLATRHQLWQMVDMSPADDAPRERQYLPKVAHTIGNVDTHDVAVDAAGRVHLIATRANCLAHLDDRASFVPTWKPHWIDAWVAEDRAHVNGLALRDGQPRYVTLCGRSNTKKGWKELRDNGGLVIDVTNDQVVAESLTMPHSPRWRHNRLWLLNSGRGELGFVDTHHKFTPIAFGAGYLRGLAFVDHTAIVGLSRPRHATFAGLPLDDEIARRGLEPWTGLLLVDTRSGETIHWLRIEGRIVELYDVVVLPRTTRAKCLSLKNDDLERNVWLGLATGCEHLVTAPRKKPDVG